MYPASHCIVIYRQPKSTINCAQLLFLNPAMLSFSDNEFNRLATLNEH